MAVVSWILRFFGWLLTPVVAWAASFVGALIGSFVSSGFSNSRHSLYLSLILGGIAAVLALLLWFRILRRSPRLQHTLQVTEDGTPVAALGTEIDAPPEQP